VYSRVALDVRPYFFDKITERHHRRELAWSEKLVKAFEAVSDAPNIPGIARESFINGTFWRSYLAGLLLLYSRRDVTPSATCVDDYSQQAIAQATSFGFSLYVRLFDRRVRQ